MREEPRVVNERRTEAKYGCANGVVLRSGGRKLRIFRQFESLTHTEPCVHPVMGPTWMLDLDEKCISRWGNHKTHSREAISFLLSRCRISLVDEVLL